MSAPDLLLKELRARPRSADRATDIYTMVLFVLVFVLPLARWSTQQIAPAAQWSPPWWTAAIVAVFAAIGVAVAGRTRGPVAVSAPYAEWVVAGPDPLASRLRPSWWRSLLVTVLAVLFVVVVAVVSRSTWPDPVGLATVLAVALGIGVLLAVTWLSGQARRWKTTALLVLLSAGAGLAWTDAWRSLDGDQAWWPLLVLPIALSTMAAVQRALSAIRPSRLRAQAVRWSRVEVFATTADLASAAAVLRAPTHLGRHWRPAFAAPPFVRRDLIGLGRAPGRTVTGLLAAAGSGLLVPVAQEAVTPLIALISVTVAYIGACFLSDGLRFHAFDRERPSAFGVGPAAAALQHLVVPTVLLTVVMGCAAILGGSPHVAVALALLVVACRALSVFKGHMPLELLTPVMTPVGEISSAGRLLWLADAVLVALLVGGTTVSQAEGWDAAAILVVAAGLVAVWARSRWRQ
ncbi:hypothetical protein BHE97_02970 [Aeromicrobium sp. PE09-221]|uniref:hypothetical protein n=1 Tax=Aeromicrobium sp. PE09-221 TaxID=1898043 RepID=UPI000B3EC802|nr:hypothetical protein [Aeromicrobium sp. PE09-221]OUZ12168.1 hypothetical protein BHE97_02970 [Aeromicrobium sp. PE09-221]